MSTATNPVSDRVMVEGLEVETVIGVYDWERTIQQRLVFDIEMEFDIKQAGRTDDVQFALDYSAVSESVIEFVEASSFELIEALAEAVVAHIFEQFGVGCVRLKLSKPGAVARAKNVAVAIERHKN